ncbi:double zinc ribbon domain-containing protein [Stygiolobus caldivivus]|uniref:DZANK-type domain-containing protein n=1 Tax=Stygiolobus caldivivus TaxID=2824673 RepID=A0A8D5ZIW0_9CREN|nr:hypothetical protein KN1_12880 [Stygiolobus caldivivus]
MKRCPSCGHLNKDDAVYCEMCRYRFPGKVCKVCGHLNPVDAVYCEMCRYKFV